MNSPTKLTNYFTEVTYFHPGQYILGKSTMCGLDDFTMRQVANRRPFTLRLNDIVQYKGCTYDPKTCRMTRYFDFNGILLMTDYHYLVDKFQRIR